MSQKNKTTGYNFYSPPDSNFIEKKHYKYTYKLNFGKIIRNTLIKAILLFNILSLNFLPLSSAFFNDVEKSQDNTFVATDLDLEFNSNEPAFSPLLMKNGQATQNALIKNAGTLDFSYSQEVANATGSAELCSALNLKVWYQYYDEFGDLQKVQKYNGLLSSFSINLLGTDPQMQNLNSIAYYSNSDYVENEHWYSYELSLPSNPDPSLGNKTCSFDIKAKAWMPEFIYPQAFHDEEILSTSVSTGSWAQVSGMKFNDENNNNAKDTGEPGLENWDIYAAQEVDSFTVNSDGTTQTSQILENGETYLIKVVGTYYTDTDHQADAKYSSKSSHTITYAGEIFRENFNDSSGFTLGGGGAQYWNISSLDGISAIPSNFTTGGNQSGNIFYGSFAKTSSTSLPATMTLNLPDLSKYKNLKLTVSLAAPDCTGTTCWEITHRDKLIVSSNKGIVDSFLPTSNASPLNSLISGDLHPNFQNFEYNISNDLNSITFAFASTDYDEVVGIDSVIITGDYINPVISADWRDTPEGLETYGSDLLDLQIDNSSVEWGSYNDSHEYWLTYTGTDSALTFDIYDILYTNNTGSLDVKIYKVAQEVQTDSSGNYEIDLTEINGEFIIAEKSQTGWVQTFPASGYYSFTSADNYENIDFGNRQVEEQDIDKIVINEVYYDVDGEHGTEDKNEWVELYNPTDHDINLQGWSLNDNVGTKPINPFVTIPSHGFAVLSHDNATWVHYWDINGAVNIQLTGSQAWLNNTGDQLTLKNGSGEIIDFVAWEGGANNAYPAWNLEALEGESIARNPLGFDTDSPTDWEVLDTPNPGTNPHSHIQLSVDQEDNHLLVGFNNAHGFDLLEYEVTYSHLYNGVLIDENIKSTANKALNQETLILPPFYLGTCSGIEGKVCMPHLIIDPIKINLLYKDGSNILGTTNVEYIWKK